MQSSTVTSTPYGPQFAYGAMGPAYGPMGPAYGAMGPYSGFQPMILPPATSTVQSDTAVFYPFLMHQQQISQAPRPYTVLAAEPDLK